MILTIIGKIGVEGALYQSMEFTGDGLRSLQIDDRFTIANMAVEAGAKNAFFPVDDIAEAYLKEAGVQPPYRLYEADADAAYTRTMEMNLDEIVPVAACPHLPSNIRKIAGAAARQNAEFIPIDQVVIGSCTNGRLSDLRIAADVVRGGQVHPGVRCIVIPGTQKIFRKCIQEGIADLLTEAGAVFFDTHVRPCLGGPYGACLPQENAQSQQRTGIL